MSMWSRRAVRFTILGSYSITLSFCQEEMGRRLGIEDCRLQIADCGLWDVGGLCRTFSARVFWVLGPQGFTLGYFKAALSGRRRGKILLERLTRWGKEKGGMAGWDWRFVMVD